MNDPDLRIDVFTNMAGTGVRIVDIRTGLVGTAEGDRSEPPLTIRARAMAMLEQKYRAQETV